MATKRPWWYAFDISTRRGRDLVLFLGGLMGVIHETFFTHGERQYLLISFGVMMGLPAYLAAKPSSSPPPQAQAPGDDREPASR